MSKDASQSSTAADPAPNLDQIMAWLHFGCGNSDVMKRLRAIHSAESELFSAAEAIQEWMRSLPPGQRHVARFNRLYDALTGVREAHQMESVNG